MRVTPYPVVLGVTALTAAGVWLLAEEGLRWVLLSVLFALCGLIVGLGVSFPQWQMFGRSVCRVRTTEKAVALTFDDGPDPSSTPVLLDLLERKGVPATFFCVGRRVAEHGDLAWRMVRENHLIGNHSHAHSPFTNLFGEARLRADLEAAQAEIARATGQVPTYYRPPMTLTNPRLFRVLRTLPLTVVGYTIRGYDRGHSDLSTVVGRVRRGLRPGAIVLLHDGGAAPDRLVALVESVVDLLQGQGYRCLRLDDLAAGGTRP